MKDKITTKQIKKHERHFYECFKLFYDIQVTMNNITQLLNQQMKEIDNEHIDISLMVPYAQKTEEI